MGNFHVKEWMHGLLEEHNYLCPLELINMKSYKVQILLQEEIGEKHNTFVQY